LRSILVSSIGPSSTHRGVHENQTTTPFLKRVLKRVFILPIVLNP
jgi:hypothetical protein